MSGGNYKSSLQAVHHVLGCHLKHTNSLLCSVSHDMTEQHQEQSTNDCVPQETWHHNYRTHLGRARGKRCGTAPEAPGLHRWEARRSQTTYNFAMSKFNKPCTNDRVMLPQPSGGGGHLLRATCALLILPMQCALVVLPVASICCTAQSG